MSELSIRVQGLGKKYHIGTEQSFDKLSDQVSNLINTPFRRAAKLLRGQATGAAELDQVFWALDDVSFDINRGEVVGIIGRNGAGKSTLLKVLSRITDPSVGHADIYGRVSSLLEVGTGFHPELTGRENIYLNGAILGMRKTDIERKFDEIVAFSDIENFLDTPVKHYSSGMYVRLAFSVAAHLEPEVLLVDEVLAVGDAEFQKKCLGKMENVASTGRTVLFVSHNMGLIQSLCKRGIMLQNGKLIADDDISTVVSLYLEQLKTHGENDLVDRTDRRGKGDVKLVNVSAYNGSPDAHGVLSTGKPAHFVFEVDNPMVGLACNFVIHDSMGHPVTAFKSTSNGPDDEVDASQKTRFICELDELLLTPGSYRLDVAIRGNGDLQDMVEAAAMIEVQDGNLRGRVVRSKQGINVGMPHRWQLPKE
ncbi:MAG: ABC transporter ATP-binding protein [Chloroflexota bacterium]